MSWRLLRLLSLVGMLGCAGVEDNNPAPRCSANRECPEELVCYRSFCVESEGVEIDSSDGGVSSVRDASVADASGSDASRSTPPTGREDAGSPSPDATTASAPPEFATPSPAPAPAAPTPPEAAPPPPTPTPTSVSPSPWRFPWRLDQLRNLPSHLLGCIGSCTIVGQKECDSCVAEKERALCDKDDKDDKDDERGRGKGCGARR